MNEPQLNEPNLLPNIEQSQTDLMGVSSEMNISYNWTQYAMVMAS